VGCYDVLVLMGVRRRLFETLPDDQGMTNVKRDDIDAIELCDRSLVDSGARKTDELVRLKYRPLFCNSSRAYPPSD
jgi:hypothetical protein